MSTDAVGLLTLAYDGRCAFLWSTEASLRVLADPQYPRPLLDSEAVCFRMLSATWA